jgi:protein SCO1/2
MNRRAMIHRLRPALALPALALLAPIALAACGAGGESPTTAERPPLEGAAIGGPFTLVNKDGKTVTWNDFKGQYRVVYFGYTFCPDACPLDMQELMKGYAQFQKLSPERAAKVTPIFITIDPQRDTPEVVGQWTGAFSPQLVGLTGTPDQVGAAAKAFAAYSAKGKETAGGYLMDHSRNAYLMDPDGKPLALLLPIEPGGPGVAAVLDKWVK